MTRTEQHCANAIIIKRLHELSHSKRHPIGYRYATIALNTEGYRTSRGNYWTQKRLIRMLQRYGISGLWGIKHQFGHLEEAQKRAFLEVIKGSSK